MSSLVGSAAPVEAEFLAFREAHWTRSLGTLHQQFHDVSGSAVHEAPGISAGAEQPIRPRRAMQHGTRAVASELHDD